MLLADIYGFLPQKEERPQAGRKQLLNVNSKFKSDCGTVVLAEKSKLIASYVLFSKLMRIVFDHTIVPSRDMNQSAKFYKQIFGFKDLGENEEELRGLQINETTVLFLEKSNDSDSSPWSQGTHHYAFGMDREKFQQVFSKVKSKKIPYGDTWKTHDNKKGPDKKAPGAQGQGKTIYFRDPSDNLLQIITY